LGKILSLKGDFFVRLGMSNPRIVIDLIDDLIEVYKHPKMFKFLHVPAQSGSDRVLDIMKRDYSADDFRFIVRRFREEIPDITISTDVICGFPTETDAEFEMTKMLIEDTFPDVVNISRFWKRPDTPAALMRQLPGGKTKDRSSELNGIFKKICLENNRKWVGWEGFMLIDEKGVKKDNWRGHNFAYRQLVIEGDHMIGEKIRVRLTSASVYFIQAKEI
jgi:tRNA A37 methylthiotransferase MiaB